MQCWCECLKAKRFTGKDVTFLASSHHDLVVLAHVAGTSAAAKGVTAGNQEVDKFGSEGGGGLILAAQVAVDQDSGSVGGSVLGLLGFQRGC